MLEAGAQVDRYTLVARLGEGGQAEVWRAIDPLSPGRPVALKLLWLDAAGSVDIERARREAHHLARLSHPALPACHALFEDLRRNLLGLVLDFVEGTALDQAVDDPRFTPDHALRVVRGLAEALAYLHDEGLVHRDVKPPNALLAGSFWSDPDAPDAVKLIDLGISVARGNPRPLTVVDQRIGTPPFMPPEQIDPAFWHGSADTPAADVFALGVLAWWLLYRTHPTSLPLTEPLPSFARAYRAIAQSGAPWPPAPLASWDPFFRLTLALPQSGRAPTASRCAGFLPPQPSPAAQRTDAAAVGPPAQGGSAPGPTGLASAANAAGVTGAAQPLATGPSRPLATGPSQPLATGPSQPLATGPSQPLATGSAQTIVTDPAPTAATGLARTLDSGPAQPLTTGPAHVPGVASSQALAPAPAGPARPLSSAAQAQPPAHGAPSQIPPTVTEPLPFRLDEPRSSAAPPGPQPSAPLVAPSPAPAPTTWRLGPRRTLLLGAGLGAALVLLLLVFFRDLLRRPRPGRRRRDLPER